MEGPKIMNNRRFLAGLSFYLLAMLISNNCTAQEFYSVKSANYWTSPIMDEGHAKNLAKYKLVIVDGENLTNNPECLKTLKSLNPNLKLINYSNPIELYYPMAPFRPGQTSIENEIMEKYPQWLLKLSNGENAIFFKNMILLNMSSDCPRVNGKTCGEYMAEKQLKILNNPIWDGYFMDNGGRNISWVYLGKQYQIDANNDGINDNPDTLDMKWEKGISDYLALISKGMKGKNLIIANKGSLDFLNQVNGRMFEKFPNNYLGDTRANGWYQCMANAQKTGLYTIFMVNYEDLSFGIASSLLTDNVYIAIDQDNSGIHPELFVDLGKPLGIAMMNDTCYYRLYEKGKVEVYPEKRKGTIIKY